jgi:hypothetical protein
MMRALAREGMTMLVTCIICVVGRRKPPVPRSVARRANLAYNMRRPRPPLETSLQPHAWGARVAGDHQDPCGRC